MNIKKQTLIALLTCSYSILSVSILSAEYAGSIPKGMYGERSLEEYCRKNPAAPECIDAE